MGFDRLKSGPGGRKGRHRGVNSMRAVSRKKRLPHNFANYNISPPSTTTISSTGTQTYTVPSRVDTLIITMYGAGGGGGRATGGRSGTTNGFGAGSGSKCVITLNEVQSGTVISFDVGAGGEKSAGIEANGNDGGDTTLTFGGTTYTAGGGNGGKDGDVSCSGCGDGGTATNGDTNTSGNNNSARIGGLSLGDSAGAGGIGSDNSSIQTHADGDDGKVIIS